MIYTKGYDADKETSFLSTFPQGLIDTGMEDVLWSDTSLCYFKNSDTKSVTPSLYCQKNNKSSLISDGVRQFQPFSNGSVAVYKDYDHEKSRKFLCVFFKKY